MELIPLCATISRKKAGGFSLPSGLKKTVPILKYETVQITFLWFYNSNNKDTATVLLMLFICAPFVNPCEKKPCCESLLA